MGKPLPDLTRVNGFTYGPTDLVLTPGAPMDSARRLLADRYTIDAGQLLYHHRGQFYGWTGTHYVEISKDYLTADVYHFLEYAKRNVCVDKKADRWELHPFNPNRNHVGEVHAALVAASFLSDSLQGPMWIGGAPDLAPTEIISCDNGLLHLPTRSILPHTPDFFTHNAIDYNYDPTAPSPELWISFLAELWPEDQESIDTLQEFFGYCLVADTSQQKALMLVGPKRSGKGTIARMLEAVIGSHNVTSPTLAGIGNQFGLAPLIGKRLAIISDARISSKTDGAVVAERLLSITGEDSVSIARKFLSDWQGKLGTRFLLLSNELPRIADASGALPSRFIVLILINSFFGKEDRGLMHRMTPERPGILNWAIAGYERLCNRGFFQQPASANDSIRDLEDLGSPISAFLRDKCIIASGKSVLCSMLFDEWKTWCDSQNRGNAGTLQTFGRDIRAAIPGLKVVQHRDLGGVNRYYEGVGIAY